MEDTKGYGFGLITTYLYRRFAASLTSGCILPGSFIGTSPDIYGGPDVPTEVKYGKALKYNLSFGYLLLPKRYENYKQMNLNLYLEFLGKAYQQATVIQYGDKTLPIKTPLLQAGNYVDICPGIQLIANSNLRFDFSVELQCINTSYTHFYPVYLFGIQRYFYLRKKNGEGH
jgi:hypothetical protein